MRLALVQMSNSGNIEENLEKSIGSTKDTASNGACGAGETVL